MLRANYALRLGLRAASRNPELAFGKALLDQTSALLAALPVALAVALLAGALGSATWLTGLARLPMLLRELSLPVAGGVLAALALAWTSGAFFWSGALPLLAADAELDARPPAGLFLRLASLGFARVAAASALGSLLSLAVSLTCSAALVFALPALLLSRRPALLAGAALVACAFAAASVLVELLGRLMLVRSAALGDGAAASFGRAAGLLSSRLGGCLAIATAFFVLELVVATAGATVTGTLSLGIGLSPGLLTLAPRLAIGLASAVVLAWLEVGRQAALAALAAGEEGLVRPPPEPVRAHPVPAVLERPRTEPVIDALPAEPVIDALPAEPVIDALPAEPAPGENEAEPRPAGGRPGAAASPRPGRKDDGPSGDE